MGKPSVAGTSEIRANFQIDCPTQPLEAKLLHSLCTEKVPPAIDVLRCVSGTFALLVSVFSYFLESTTY